jgi:hypothetical protein
MSALEHARGLLVMARKDFDALRGMVDNPLFAEEIFGFHAQQAIEKSLKAWLTARSLTFPMTHDLSRLLDLLEENGVDVSPFWPLVQYSVFAVQARYEVGLMETESHLDRVAVISEVQQLLVAIASATGLAINE